MDKMKFDVNDAETLERLLGQRFSCRAFRPDPVPQEILDRIMAIAQRTASWSNAQPWHTYVTRGNATERFCRTMLAPPQEGEAGADFAWPSEYRGIYKERRRECGFALYKSVGIENGDREASKKQARENYRLFGAPHVAIITTDDALGIYGAVDCGAYVANLLLAAASLGVDCIAQGALAARPQRVRDFFGLGADRLIVCGISLGYADHDHPANGFRTGRANTAVEWID
jgi:nitroreductase